MKQFFDGKVENGRIKLKNSTVFNRLVSSLKNGSEVRLTLSKLGKDRSNSQNRYYHGVVVAILGDHFGEFHDDMHENLAWLFLKVQDKPYPKRASTASLSTSEFEDYLEKVRMWALTEHEVRIPLPNEVDLS